MWREIRLTLHLNCWSDSEVLDCIEVDRRLFQPRVSLGIMLFLKYEGDDVGRGAK